MVFLPITEYIKNITNSEYHVSQCFKFSFIPTPFKSWFGFQLFIILVNLLYFHPKLMH